MRTDNRPVAEGHTGRVGTRRSVFSACACRATRSYTSKLVNRLGNPVACAAGDYWNIARPALLEKNVMASGLIPGHAGRFETSLVLGVRPDLVDQEAIADMGDEIQENAGLDVGLSGAMVQVHGEWQAGLGYTDNPADASPEEGKAMLEIITDSVATFYAAFSGS